MDLCGAGTESKITIGLGYEITIRYLWDVARKRFTHLIFITNLLRNGIWMRESFDQLFSVVAKKEENNNGSCFASRNNTELFALFHRKKCMKHVKGKNIVKKNRTSLNTRHPFTGSCIKVPHFILVPCCNDILLTAETSINEFIFETIDCEKNVNPLKSCVLKNQLNLHTSRIPCDSKLCTKNTQACTKPGTVTVFSTCSRN